MFSLMNSRTSVKSGHVGLKTRLQGQIVEKPCACFRGHIFDPILMKLGQNVCLDEIVDEFEIGSCGVESRSIGQGLEKKLCTFSRPHF